MLLGENIYKMFLSYLQNIHGPVLIGSPNVLLGDQMRVLSHQGVHPAVDLRQTRVQIYRHGVKKQQWLCFLCLRSVNVIVTEYYRLE